MKLHKVLLSLAVVSAMPFAAVAQESSTTTDTSTSTSVKKSETGVSDLKDVDQEITNAKLRAESGSKKKWSFRSWFNYEGSNLQKPLASDRPKIGGNQGLPRNSSLRGLLGVKYRAGDNDNISVRTGIAYVRPFGGDMPDKSSKTEVADPLITWDHTAKVGGFQLITSVNLEKSTARHKTAENQFGVLNPGFTTMYAFQNGLELGAALDLNYYHYTDSTTAGFDGRGQYEVGLYPMAEYALSDKVSLRTVFRYSTYGSSRTDQNTYKPLMHTQSLGVGIAVTRDFYMYPNVQFDPSNNTAEYTNWALSTNINL